ncbi:PH domain-containing protein [Fusarium sp. LHS14.1]|nr:PH domain-containing protein [Fusarium sp. LHS14.1]
MASSLASDKPSLPAPGAAQSDPFVASTPAPAHHRYSTFDHDLFISGPAASPRSAKRALEAHLAETERRLEEAGKLGTALVSQRKALTEQLQEVDKLQSEGELNPELRQKLVDIEKEYNSLARESARAFLPKQRVPSNEANPSSPFAPESRGGRRSISPSKFESQATGSPTKLSVPNRKIRNQPSNRVHDIEFAAEISTSLIAQVRNLQALLAERDEETKDLKADKSRLEIECEAFQQRVKTLDESENRYKEENWNLETKLQELSAQQKESADREKKLAQALNVIKTEKVTAQRELDEVKLHHARLIDQHAAAVKQHDTEIGAVKRNIAMAEGERAAMQRRIDDLTGQNQELARAFSTQRNRVMEHEPNLRPSDDDFESAADHITPEHSPPQSPIKGTPRHAVLETETVKSSLHHAQRTIQSQRSLLHREKTEKLELRRIIQDLRDDLEKARTDATEHKSHRRSRKPESKEFKKPPRLLGSFRSSRQEVVADDGEWEDQHDVSPRGSLSHASPRPSVSPMSTSSHTILPSIESADNDDHFDTANEASESAFETANERATETEDFQTVNEQMSGSDGETETEGTTRGFGKMKKPPSLPSGLARHASRHSFHSTASTSADEDDFAYHLRTPTSTIGSQKSTRFRMNRSIFHRASRQASQEPLYHRASRQASEEPLFHRISRQASEEPPFQSSPASFASSRGGTPQATGQSLFAELQDFDGSDDESLEPGTPSRRRARSGTPASFGRGPSPQPPVPPLPKVTMVDSGSMTDPISILTTFQGAETPRMITTGVMTEDEESIPASPISVVVVPRPTSLGSVVDHSEVRSVISWTHEDHLDNSRPISMSYSDAGAQHDPDMEEKLALFPAPPTMLPPILPPTLSMSSIASEDVEPREEVEVPPTPPTLTFTPLSNQSVEPLPEPEIPLPTLSFSSIKAEDLTPRAEPEAPLPDLSLTTIITEQVEPIAEPETPIPELSFTNIVTEQVEPIAEPEAPLPDLSLTAILTEHVEPIAEPEIPPPVLSLTSIATEQVEPIAEPEVPLSLATIMAQELEPVAEPEVPLPELTMTTVMSETVEPIAEPEVPPPALSLSIISAESVEPIAEPPVEPVMFIPPPPALSMSEIVGEHVEPIASMAPELAMSAIQGEHIEPIAQRSPDLTMSAIRGEHVEPVAEREREPIIPAVVIPPPPPAPELSFSTIQGEQVEPVAIKAPELAISSIKGESVEPIAEPVPEPIVPRFTISSIHGEHVEPVVEPMPELSLSTISREHVEPIAERAPDLSLSTISGQHVEPVAERLPELRLSTISGEQVEPIAERAPELSLSSISGQHVEPIAEPIPEPVVPQLSISNIQGEHVEPVALPAPNLALSSISAEAIEPIKEPKQVVPPPSLNFSSIYAENCEPREEPQPTPVKLGYSNLSTQHVEPVSEAAPSLGLSAIASENVKPVLEPIPAPPTLVMSSIAGEGVEPISPVVETPKVPVFGFSSIESVETIPVAPRTPKRDGFILPRDMNSPFKEREVPETPKNKTGSPLGREMDQDSSSLIAEDETSQSPADTPEPETPDSQQPLREIPANLNGSPTRKALVPTSDQGAQTALTAEAIDAMFRARAQPVFGLDKSLSLASPGTPGTAGTTGTVRIRRSRESFESPIRRGLEGDDVFDTSSIRRPGSSRSGRASLHDAPPLPANHRQVIEAARSGSSQGNQSNMGPPLWPASALRQRPSTPGQRPTSPMSARATPTPHIVRNGGGYGDLGRQSPAKLTDASRKSSQSSFASELDSRFNMRPGELGIDPSGFGPNTDPRMIQAITQTMIGEYLWKYTRKTGRGGMSENRHRRYFWVHPYTRTLYWSERDPSSAGRAELKAKSVPIEAVRVVTDDNPMPPGLHRKSLVIISPGRTIKFTCTTGQRHETWFNALSYLLLRTNDDVQADTEDMAEHFTREDVDEFNPQFGQRAVNGTRPGVPASLSSYNSRTTRNESQAVGVSMNIPTLTPKSQPQRPNGTLSKLSGYWKGSQLSGTFSSRRGRGASAQNVNIYEASEAHDSAEDVREIIERQDREADRLENVRACCDGKHDVGTLHHHHFSKRGRHGNNHTHSHQGLMASHTTMASLRSRA